MIKKKKVIVLCSKWRVKTWVQAWNAHIFLFWLKSNLQTNFHCGLWKEFNTHLPLWSLRQPIDCVLAQGHVAQCYFSKVFFWYLIFFSMNHRWNFHAMCKQFHFFIETMNSGMSYWDISHFAFINVWKKCFYINIRNDVIQYRVDLIIQGQQISGGDLGRQASFGRKKREYFPFVFSSVFTSFPLTLG